MLEQMRAALTVVKSKLGMVATVAMPFLPRVSALWAKFPDSVKVALGLAMLVLAVVGFFKVVGMVFMLLLVSGGLVALVLVVLKLVALYRAKSP